MKQEPPIACDGEDVRMMRRKRDNRIAMYAEQDLINSGDPIPECFQRPRSVLR